MPILPLRSVRDQGISSSTLHSSPFSGGCQRTGDEPPIDGELELRQGHGRLALLPTDTLHHNVTDKHANTEEREIDERQLSAGAISHDTMRVALEPGTDG